MTRFRSLVSFLVLLAALFASRPARAQSSPTWDDMGRALSTTGLVYAAGGTAAFLIVDLVFVTDQKPLPLELTVSQFAFAHTLFIGGMLAATQGNTSLSGALIASGGTLVAIPIIEYATRAGRNQPRTALRLAPTAITFSGTF